MDPEGRCICFLLKVGIFQPVSLPEGNKYIIMTLIYTHVYIYVLLKKYIFIYISCFIVGEIPSDHQFAYFPGT